MSTERIAATRVPLGQVVATPGALGAFEANGRAVAPYLARHASGDWGDVDAEDWRTNDHAVENRARLLSAYTLPDGTRVWLITEADRSVTTILLPSEY